MASALNTANLRAMKPEEAEAQSRLAKIMRGRRETKPGHLPGIPEATFRWRILTGTEKQECQAGAVRRFNELQIPVELRMYSNLEEEHRWQVLFFAMRDDSDAGTDTNPYPKTLARDVAELRDSLSDDDRDTLILQYMDFESEVDPSPTTLSPETFQQLEIALKKKEADRILELSNFDSRTLRIFLHTTVGPLLTSLTGKSSPLRTESEIQKLSSEPLSLAPTQASRKPSD